MEEVLGYETEQASPQEALQTAEEMRLLRLQTEVLIEEIRLMRQALQPSAEPAAEEAPPEEAPPRAPAPAPEAQAPPGLRQTGFPPVPASPVPQPLRSRGEAFEQQQAPPAAAAAAGPGATVRLVSAGFETGNAADFIVDGQRIELSGEWGRRGVNAVAIDPGTGQVLSRKVYDIWGNPAVENAQLAADLNGLSDGVVVLVALKDSGMENLEPATIQALQEVGSTISAPLGVREGYVLVGSKGGTALAESRGPRAEVEAVLPCAVELPTGPPPAPAAKAPPPSPFAAPAQTAGGPQAPAFPFAAPAQPAGVGQVPPPSPFAAPAQPARVPQAPPPPFAAPARPAAAPQAVPRPPPPQQQSPLPPFPVAPQPQAVGGQGGVTFSDAVAEQEADEQGEDWQEVVLMLERLQEKIQAKRLAGQRPSS